MLAVQDGSVLCSNFANITILKINTFSRDELKQYEMEYVIQRKFGYSNVRFSWEMSETNLDRALKM